MDKTANIDPLRICPHDTVKREFNSEENYLDKWTCQMCHAEFFTLDGMKAGKITVMEPQPTLRDQVAMAALRGILSDPDEFWVGETMKENLRLKTTSESYKWADAMLKAREK